MTRCRAPEPRFVSCSSIAADAPHSARPPPWSVLVRGQAVRLPTLRSLSVRAPKFVTPVGLRPPSVTNPKTQIKHISRIKKRPNH